MPAMPAPRDLRTIGQPPALIRLTRVAERVGMDPRTAEDWLTRRFGYEVIPVGASGVRYVRRADADALMDYLGVPSDAT